MFARPVFRSAQPIKNVRRLDSLNVEIKRHAKRSQSIRRYATEGPLSGGSNTLLYAGIGAAVAGAGGYYYYTTKPKFSGAEGVSTSEPQPAKALTPKGKAFTGGDQGWIDLKLEHVEPVNGNVKKFRFKLPNEDDVSGLQVACKQSTGH